MIAGLILNGGASSRFGSPKQDARIDKWSLGEIALERLKRTCTSIASVGAPLSQAQTCRALTCDTLKDAGAAERGPLAGVLAGLRWAAAGGAEWLMVTPCDVPLLTPHILADMTEKTQDTAASVGLLQARDGPHPLCAVWSTSLMDQLEATLATHHPAIIQFMAEHSGCNFEVDDAQQLINVNTPADLQRCIELTSKHWWKTPVA